MIADTINYAVSIADCQKKNEQPPFKNFGLQLLNHFGGCSPFDFSIYQYRHASTACDLFAKTCLSICESIQSITSWLMVTFKRGLYSFIVWHTVASKLINNDKIVFNSISPSGIGVAKYERNRPISERAERIGWKLEIVQHRGSGRKIRQYPMQDHMGILHNYGRFCEGRAREHDVGSHSKDLRHSLKEAVA